LSGPAPPEAPKTSGEEKVSIGRRLPRRLRRAAETLWQAVRRSCRVLGHSGPPISAAVSTIINRGDVPAHVFNIPELDFSQDLFAERLSGQWFRLGAWTINPRRDERGVEDVVWRQSFLLIPGQFSELFNDLDSVGNVIGDLGKPQGSVHYAGDAKEYRYAPFHRFEFDTAVTGEPLVFLRETTLGSQLFINPDLWLFFRL